LLDIDDMDRPLVIHGVQHLFHPPVLLEAWPSEDRRSRLVFIVRNLERELFEHMLAAFAGGGTGC
jgi:G3E family GTPase